MDLSAIIDEFNRRKAQAGQRIGEMFTPPKKPVDWFEQMQQGQNAVVTPEQRSNVHKELADIAERMAAGMVPEPIRARERAMRTDPSAAAKPFTSEEVKGITPFVTAAAPIAYHGTPHDWAGKPMTLYRGEMAGQKSGNYFSTDREWARQFTQSGQDKEIRSLTIHPDEIYKQPSGLPKAYGADIPGQPNDIDKAIAAAKAAGKKAILVDEGAGQPNSVFVFDPAILEDVTNTSKPAATAASAPTTTPLIDSLRQKLKQAEDEHQRLFAAANSRNQALREAYYSDKPMAGGALERSAFDNPEVQQALKVRQRAEQALRKAERQQSKKP